MESFRCDYAEGCAPQILEALQKSNMEQTDGYGCDDHCYHAAKLIKERFKDFKIVDASRDVDTVLKECLDIINSFIND